MTTIEYVILAVILGFGGIVSLAGLGCLVFLVLQARKVPAPRPKLEQVEVQFTVVETYETRGLLGDPKFMVRVQAPDGRLGEGKIPGRLFYVLRPGDVLPIFAEKRGDELFVPGLRSI